MISLIFYVIVHFAAHDSCQTYEGMNQATVTSLVSAYGVPYTFTDQATCMAAAPAPAAP